MAPTPKSQDRKRKPPATANDSLDTPAKKRTGRNKETVINLDVEDPFNFEKKEDSHPEPLKNISIERTAFGGVKFSRSPPSALQRYVSVEKIAERRGNVSGTVTSPISTPTRPGSLSSLGTSFNLQITPSLANKSVATLKSTKGRKTPARAQNSIKKTETNEEEENEDENNTSNVINSSALNLSKRRSKVAEFEASATPKEKKLTLDDYCVVPTLTPTEQLEVDHGQEHKLLEAGARVLALWGQDYYAANICGRDGLSRYYVHFVEDNLNRLLPPNGVVPLSALKNGTTISFITEQEDQEVGKQAGVVSAPSRENAIKWASGEFKLNVEDEGDFDRVSWTKIFLTKEQHKVISASVVNTTIDIEEENIVNESRSSRRSRSTRFSLDGGSANNVTAKIVTPKSVSRSKTPRFIKTPALIEEDGEETAETIGKEESPQKVAFETSNSRSTRAFRRSTALTPVVSAAKTTPARGRSTRKSNVTEEVVREEKAEITDVEANENNVVEASEATTAVSDAVPEGKQAKEKPEKIEEVAAPDVEETVNNTSTETDDSKTVEDVTDNGVENDQSLVEKMEVDEVAANVINDVESSNVANESNHENKLNGSSVVEETQENNKVESPNVSVNEENNVDENKAIDVVPPAIDVAVPGTTETFSNGENRKTVSENQNNSNTNNTAEQTETGSNQSFQIIPIASIPSPSSEQEATIFQNMKFVLTSATRSKKNSDFQKRDYRTKIEERGGEIIEDFSAYKDGDNAFLIADTYYRTHKYLSALSISVPCVKHNWILACVFEKRLLDHIPYMLPAGESSLDQNKICEWKPLKNILLLGKSVWVYSNIPTKTEERSIGFVDIWSSIIKNLGANTVDQFFSSLVEKLDHCAKSPVDILLTDSSCEKELAERVEAEGGIAVSSEWVIQAIVTGELPDVSGSERFRFDSTA